MNGTRKPCGLVPSVSFLFLRLSVAIVVTSLASCKNLTTNAPSPDVISDVKIQKNFTIDSSRSNFSELRNAVSVRGFYATNDFKPIWFVKDSLIVNGDSLIDLMSQVRYYGLKRNNYHYPELVYLQNQKREASARQRIELLLTDGFFSLAHDLKWGLLIENRSTDSATHDLLDSAVRNNAVIKSLLKGQPQRNDYEVSLLYLRQLLDCSDSLAKNSYFNGSESDTTVESNRLHALEINMHRWRRDHELLRGRYILANIPAYELELYDSDTLALTSRIIVGRKQDATPVLQSVIKSFVIFPHWTVPRRIAVNELLPQMQNDSSYISKHNYEILDPEGNAVDPTTVDFASLNRNNFPYTIRQDEGEGNALGLIKFSFSNPYSVYLHDTNARYLFNNKKRALSHGCVRVEKALDIARLLLKDNTLVTPEDLDQYLEVRSQRTIGLRTPIPIYIRYYTIGVKGGELTFYDDVYGMDKSDAALLEPTDSVAVLNP